MPKKTAKRVIYSNFDSEEDYFNTVYSDLNIRVPGDILAIADMGLWNGRKIGWKCYNRSVNSILSSSCDKSEWYSDGHNIKSTMQHHDGTNYLEYRVIRKGRDISKLTSKLYNQIPVTRQEINYYTESLLPYVAKELGW